MPCETCGHTLASLPYMAMEVKQFHCDRCGTLVIEYPGGHRDVYRPKLVDRCRDFEADMAADVTRATHDAVMRFWQRGITESIRLPEDRRAT